MYSLNQIHNTILAQINDEYQKTQGFPTYDITRGISFGQYLLWKKAFEIQEKQNVDNLSGGELERFIYQRSGLSRKREVQATGNIRIVSGGGQVNIGSIFESETGVQFASTTTKTVSIDSLINVLAIKGGTAGNVPLGCIKHMPITIKGIGSVINDAAMTGGYEAETDKELRLRYYECLQIPATCGNKYHYIKWAKEVNGVGGAKCIPCWMGKNTVKTIVIGNDNKPADIELVETVQNYIDPNQNGYGEGVAPVGAVCTVVSAEGVKINVDFNLTITSNANQDKVKLEINEELEKYISTLAFKTNYISYGKIGAVILDVENVLDYDQLKLNDNQANIEIGEYDVAILGVVNIIVNPNNQRILN